MAKYPDIKINKDLTENSFLLEGRCKPSFWKRRLYVIYEGKYRPDLKDYIVVHETIVNSFSPTKLIDIFKPEESIDDVFNYYKQKLEERLSEYSES